MSDDLLENNIENILRSLLPDDKLDRVTKSTPKRVTESLRYFTKGYSENIKKIIGDALFESDSKDIVLVKDIEFYSMCEHHLLPFFGHCHIAYIPNGKIIGLSKIPRIVKTYARRLQLQENLTSEIAHSLMNSINALGVAVIIEAKHFCMMMRGVKTQNAKTVTKTMLGSLKENQNLSKEFFNMLNMNSSQI